MRGLEARPIRVVDFWPDKATYQPGQAAAACARLYNAYTVPAAVVLELRVYHLANMVRTQRLSYVVAPGETTVVLPIELPTRSFMGYGLDLLLSQPGQAVVEASTAVDVLEDWTQAPRYGFLSDFTPADRAAMSNVQTLARYHVNVVQFYDWMWRHYSLMPPSADFTDALGRELSLSTVREKVAECHERGMAALGYAAVYGAEPEYALKHPEEMLYDAAGEPYSLERLFYVMNIHPDNPWRQRILAEMASAAAAVPFDGLHLDQYGFPKEQAYGPGPHPRAYRLDEDFPPFIDEARKAVRLARQDSRVIFNAVDNWPIEAVAPTTQDATYIEVWPPYESYSDLQQLILEAKRLAPAKQVILAAYLKPLLDASTSDLPGAERAALLASAAIWANGGFHLLLGEGNGALCDPYYPKYARMRPAFVQIMRAYYDFVVRYENVLSDRALVTAPYDQTQEEVRVHATPAGVSGEAGTVWIILRDLPGFRVVSLVNLSAMQTAEWNVAKPEQPELQDLMLEIRTPMGQPVVSAFIASPDRQAGRPEKLTITMRDQDVAQTVTLNVPFLRYWTLLVLEIGN